MVTSTSSNNNKLCAYNYTSSCMMFIQTRSTRIHFYNQKKHWFVKCCGCLVRCCCPIRQFHWCCFLLLLNWFVVCAKYTQTLNISLFVRYFIHVRSFRTPTTIVKLSILLLVSLLCCSLHALLFYSTECKDTLQKHDTQCISHFFGSRTVSNMGVRVCVCACLQKAKSGNGYNTRLRARVYECIGVYVCVCVCASEKISRPPKT